MADSWFYKSDGQEHGPIAFEDLSQLVKTGSLSREDSLRRGKSTEWMLADSVVGLFPDPEELADLGDLQFTFESDATGKTTAESDVANSVQTVNEPSEMTDLDELNFDMVTEESIPKPAHTKASTLPSVATPDVEEDWYFRSLGQELGPMTFEELCSLGESGAMNSDDECRHGTDSEWQPASQHNVLAMLMKTAAPPIPAVAEDEAVQAETTAPTKPKKSKKKRRASRQAAKTAKTPVAEPIDDEPIDDELIDDELIDDDDDEEELPQAPAAATERWFCKIDGVEHGPLEFADLKAMATHRRLSPGDQVRLNDDGQWALATTVTGLFAGVGPAPSAASAPPTSPTPPMGGGSCAPSTGPSRPKMTNMPKSKRVKAARGPMFGDMGENKPIIIAMGVIGGLIALLVGINLMTSGAASKEKYTILTDLYTQHKQLREKKASKAEWDALAAQVSGLQTTMVPELLKVAGSKNRKDQALLFAARDFLPKVIIDSRTKPSGNETQFKLLLDEAAKLLGISGG